MKWNLRKQCEHLILKATTPLSRGLAHAGVTPNILTTIGLLFNMAGAGVLVFGVSWVHKGDIFSVGVGCALFLLAGVFDILDGQVARYGGRTSQFGALYDSTLDRYGEFMMFFGICHFLVSHQFYVSSVWAFAALMGSMMVSYVRARSEGLGVECKIGLMQRPERIVIISVSGIVSCIVSLCCGEKLESIYILTIPLAIVAVLSNITAFSRIKHCRSGMHDDSR